MNKTELARLALRLYAEKGYWHNVLVQNVMTNGDIEQTLRYAKNCGNDLSSDLPTLLDLSEKAHCRFIDLFNFNETLEQTFSIPVAELDEWHKRFDVYAQQKLSPEAFAFFQALVYTDCDISFLPESMRDMAMLAREQNSIVKSRYDNAMSTIETESDNDVSYPETHSDNDNAPKPERVIEHPGIQIREAWSSILGY